MRPPLPNSASPQEERALHTVEPPYKSMPKRRFIAEDDDYDGYSDAECPECGAIINTHFQRGRNWRRLQCPVCHRRVMVSIKEQETPLIQLRLAGEK